MGTTAMSHDEIQRKGLNSSIFHLLALICVACWIVEDVQIVNPSKLTAKILQGTY